MPYGIDRLTTDLLDSADRLSFVGAVVVVVVWPAVAVLLGWLRLRRLEA
jgi:hypothetical protein